MMNWPQEVAALAMMQQRLREASNAFWDCRPPLPGASPIQMRVAQECVGHALDPEYASFLCHANGWRAFFQNIDLFGTAELIGGPRQQHAQYQLAALDDEAIIPTGTTREHLLAIGVSPCKTTDAPPAIGNLFLQVRPDAPCPGRVFWFAGEIIECFKSFDDFFRGMVVHNQHELLHFLRCPGNA